MNTIKIYRRKNSSVYQMKVKVTGYPAFRRSTGETDQVLAQQIAEDFLQDKLADKKAGKNLCACKFDALAGVFLLELKQQFQARKINLMSYKLNVYAIHNYLLPYFGDRDINAVNGTVIRQYVEWRRNNGRNGKVPSNDTVNRSIIIFKNVLRMAVDKGLIGESQQITFKSLPVKSNRRPAFTETDLQNIWDNYDDFVADAQSVSTRKYREDMRDLLTVLAYTGCRPHEILPDKRLGHRGLRWCDVEQFKDGCVILHVTGKTGPREVVAPQQVKFALDRMRSAHRQLTEKDTVFYGTYKRQFQNLLSFTGVLCDARGNRFSMYSFRHAYATQHLLQGANEHLLKKNMGTSSKMLDDHYSHVKPRMAYKQLLLKKS